MTRCRVTHKHHSQKKPAPYVFDCGLNRREFLANSVLLAVFLATKPTLANDHSETEVKQAFTHSNKQQAIIEVVQQQLFPDDGDGPSAKDLQAFRYLQWALEDQKNIDDGDPEFILRGITWLEEKADEQFKRRFITLTPSEQQQILTELAKSKRGENWMSLLVYYLLEALLLDPVYGGNPEQIGWQWLQHQPGYPRPPKEKTYRRYQEAS